ncbi:MAG TPA: hypothetical protein VMT77_07640 [Gemmatimonadales bacterium]|nr:hypothetical protein [Gemmatimonadales bacterium]
MKARLLLALLVAGSPAACGRSPARLEVRTFALHHMDMWRARDIISPYVDTTRPGAAGAMSTAPNALTVRETADNLDRIGRVLAQYDQPEPSVRLTFNIIEADGASRSDSSIRDIEATLRSLFKFRGYALVAEGLVTGAQGSRTTQMLAGAGGPYRLDASIEWVAGAGDSATVRLGVKLDFVGGSFTTTVGIPAGKTAILGNVKGGPPNSALILTVRPDLVTF